MYNNFIEHFQLPVTAILFMFGTTGNVIVLIIIISNKDMRTVPNMYLLNLAISDLILLTFFFVRSCLSRIAIDPYYFIYLGTLIIFCGQFSPNLTAYSTALLSFQRYRVIANPFHVRVSSQPTWRVAVLKLCGVWIVAALFALPKPIIFLRFALHQEFFNYYKYIVLFELLVTCVFPLCVIAFCYFMTHRHLVGSSRSTSERTQHPELNTRKITAKVLLGLTVVFLISYVPNYAIEMFFFSTIVDWENNILFVYMLIKEISLCFLLINSCLNPVALFCTSTQFRKHLKLYLTCRCKANSPPPDIELTIRN